MVNLSNIKKGDFVVFKNGEFARVNDFSRYDENKLNLYFDRRVLEGTAVDPTGAILKTEPG